jgi:4-hydroxy-tetrahydrodipicolinate reductase
MPRLLILGHGRMGSLVESLAGSYGFEVAAVITAANRAQVLDDPALAADVAVDFTLPDAVPENLPRLAARRIPVVVGTTGWDAHLPALRDQAAAAGIGVVAASNFSVGMYLFQAVVQEAARRFAAHEEFGAWIHEAHHDRKQDAPSGTAIALRAGMERAGFPRAIDVASTRAGFIPGTHTVGFDGLSETITLTHAVRDRAVFARGALVAARWVIGRRGWFGLRDVLEQP